MLIDYDNAMGRIIAVNLAHWRKDQQKRTKQSQSKREYQENVQEVIETTNEGTFLFYCMFLLLFEMKHFLSGPNILLDGVLSKNSKTDVISRSPEITV